MEPDIRDACNIGAPLILEHLKHESREQFAGYHQIILYYVTPGQLEQIRLAVVLYTVFAA